MKVATILPLLLGCALALAIMAAAPASAHAILVDSTPGVHGSIAAGHETVVLRFNARIDRERSRLTLIAGKTQTRLAIGTSGPDDVMTANADLQHGDYTLRWQVLAVDGHITRGDVAFTVTAP